MLKRLEKNRARICFALLVILAIVSAVLFFRTDGARCETDSSDIRHTLVLDPGHGGIDGGAVSDDGTKESDLNLSIAKKAYLIAELIGQRTEMTRVDDSVRTEYASYSEREELILRTAMINATPGAIVVSIHQNDFPTGQPSGAQVLYSSYEGSRELGITTHDNLVRLLDPQNRRVAEPAPKNLYITANAACPTILVECGFMSNNFEVLKLCDENYQCSIATILIASLTQYLTSSEII